MVDLFARLLPIVLIGAFAASIAWLVSSRDALAHAWWRWRHPHPVPVMILVSDAGQRRQLERALGAALQQLDHIGGVPCPASMIVVQRLVWDGWGGDGGRQVHGCAQRPGRCAADPRPRFCLALEAEGRALPLDEVLATLAELWSLHLKGDDREFVPVIFSPTPRPHRATDPRVSTRHDRRPLVATDD